jgi:hypothetical protein
MVTIYCIEDLNGLKYIGSTKQTLHQRLYNHRCHCNCSSRLLDLDNCKIYSLEECTEENRNVREQYWIDNTECVNMLNTVFDRKKHDKEYYQKNKDKYSKQHKEYYQKNKDKYSKHDKKYTKEYYQKNKDKLLQQIKEYRNFKNTWGGDSRNHNNLLKIDPNLFL